MKQVQIHRQARSRCRCSVLVSNEKTLGGPEGSLTWESGGKGTYLSYCIARGWRGFLATVDNPGWQRGAFGSEMNSVFSRYLFGHLTNTDYGHHVTIPLTVKHFVNLISCMKKHSFFNLSTENLANVELIFFHVLFLTVIWKCVLIPYCSNYCRKRHFYALNVTLQESQHYGTVSLCSKQSTIAHIS